MKTKGFSLISTLIIGTVAILIVSGLVNLANSNLRATKSAIASERALQTAEAGIEYYKWLLSSGGSLSNPTTLSYRDRDNNVIGNFTLTPTVDLSGVTLRSRGEAGGAVRSIKVLFVEGEGVSFRYGVQSGTGGFVLGANSEIEGSVYSNGSVTGSNNSSVTGDVFAVGSISGVDVGGQTQTGVEPQELPVSNEDILRWKDEADQTVLTGNRNLSGSNNTLGPAKIVGNLSLAGNGAILVTGTIWVTGNLSLGNNAVVRLSSSYGNRGGMVIVDGTISIGNNVSLDGSGQPESALMVLTTSSSGSAMNMGNNTSSVILYAPNGTINLGNNADIKVISANRVVLGSNVELQYEQGFASALFTSGPSGGWQMQNWLEVPNN